MLENTSVETEETMLYMFFFFKRTLCEFYLDLCEFSFNKCCDKYFIVDFEIIYCCLVYDFLYFF